MDSEPAAKVVVIQECYDATGSHRVLLRYVRDPDSRWQGMNFFSISWEHKSGDLWSVKSWISEPSFRDASGHQMWVVEIHEFSRVTGIARIMVGELLPISSGGAWAGYSWRDWDLVENVQMQKLRTCNPGEPFDGYEC